MNKLSKFTILFFSIIALQLSSCKTELKNDDILKNNSLLKVSELPYGVPDFTKIKDSDFLPALEYGINEKLSEIDKIANNNEAPTFENVFLALEQSGQILNRITGVFYLLSSANTNPVLQDIEEKLAPKISNLTDAIFLNDKLFDKVKTIYDGLDTLNLDDESKRLVEYYYQSFILSGTNLKSDDKEKLKKLNAERAQLSAKFSTTLVNAAKNAALVVDNKEQLLGFSENALKAAAQNASENNMDGKYLIPLQNTTQQPALTNLQNRETREKLFNMSWMRASNNDSLDTKALITRIAKIRAEQASLLGYPNYATWTLQNQMAKTPEAVFAFLNKIVPASIKNGKKEAVELQKLMDKDGNNYKLQPWDWDYYAEKLRKEKYDLNEADIKPYFELNNVLEKGVFYAASQLYGIRFKERFDIPVYNTDVRVFELFNSDSSAIGLFYCDYYKRDNKSGGAWMSNITEQSKLLGNKPVIYNVCNFTKPIEGQAALISYDDVTTMFHEFGHALHGFFADQQYPSIAGTNVARDFVELPSQFNEHWASYPDVFKNYAIHYERGEPMPQALVDKLNKTSTFNQGYALTELLAAVNLDLQWHTISANDEINDVDKFEKEALIKTNLYIQEIPPRYRSTYFMHIWGHEYAAGYYAYLWAEMLDNDAYAWFTENGGLTRENGDRFRKMILSRGNTMDYSKMFNTFAGREPDITPMLKNRGLVN